MLLLGTQWALTVPAVHIATDVSRTERTVSGAPGARLAARGACGQPDGAVRQVLGSRWEMPAVWGAASNGVPTLSLLPVPRVEVCYQRMENPGCQVVDASPPREEVLQAVLSLIRKSCG